ncbi:Glutamyl-tRNA(Gln) amidotransferase subunit A [uncultured Desulfobacterium sp.]|uniref:Glutamyl-tRNA(Gln) amidotransferase subunit A n=1 Tax=uncultured Desulfobacterium sp. TaxID=201089 RepID=A0A445MTW0_9BACT|nr:Glutamyl-tRNA(Gln) amidotransferase subunit A [uncultured Desulfobacterium sp.]
MELCDRSAFDLSGLLNKGDVSSRQITESVLKRADDKEKSINAFITLSPETALRQADEADKRISAGKRLSPLDGIPVAVKDNICTKGIRTTCGSDILSNFIPTYNATVVERLLSAGAVLVGKTNMDEFGMGSSTENSIIGPTRNPVDTACVSGGSSGGSAAAVASGETIISLGTDTGGSIRLPAAFCGVAGIKPTYGRVSRYGLISYASSLDQIGAIGRTVDDCAMMLNCICGHDRMDTTSADVAGPDFLLSRNKGVKGLKIGLPMQYFVEGLDQAIKERIMKVVELLAEEGAEIIEVSLPHAEYAVSAYYLIATAEASSNLARYDGVKYGNRSGGDDADLIDMYEATRSLGFGREVKRRIMLGTYVLSAGYYDAYYLKAQKARTLIKGDFDRAFEQADCLIGPVSPCLPFRLGEKMSDPLQMYLVDIYTVSLNLAGLPGMSINCGKAEGLPVGLQIIGKAFDEMTVITVGKTCEHLGELCLNKKTVQTQF